MCDERQKSSGPIQGRRRLCCDGMCNPEHDPITMGQWGRLSVEYGAITRSDAAYAAIGVSREKERIVGFIKAGYPEKIPSITKKAVEEIRAYLP